MIRKIAPGAALPFESRAILRNFVLAIFRVKSMGRTFSCLSAVLVSFSLVIFSSCDEDPETPIVSITKFPYNKDAALSITFDDGCPSVFTKIVPALEEKGLEGSFFIIAGNVQTDQEWEAWKSLTIKGHEVGNHSLHHSRLGPILDTNVLQDEINTSHQLMSEKMGQAPFTFSHPYHSTSPITDEIVFERHYATRISPSGFCKMISLDNMENFNFELSQGLSSNDWMVTTAHGVDDCFQPISEELLSQFIDVVVSHSDYLHVDTFENLSKYKIERCNTHIDIRRANDDFIITLSDDLADDVFNYPLTVSITGIDMSNREILPSGGNEISSFSMDGYTYVTLSPGTSFIISGK